MALNVIVASIGLLLAKLTPLRAVVDAGVDDADQPAPGAKRVYLAIAISGMTALSSEVIWTRLLSLLFGATVYTFSLILAVFLVGPGHRQQRRVGDRA